MSNKKCKKCNTSLVLDEEVSQETCSRCLETIDDAKDEIKDTQENVICGTCDTVVEEDGEGLLCEMCRVWYHNCCNRNPLAPELYDLLNAAPDNIKWFCDKCLMNPKLHFIVSNSFGKHYGNSEITCDLNNTNDNDINSENVNESDFRISIHSDTDYGDDTYSPKQEMKLKKKRKKRISTKVCKGEGNQNIKSNTCDICDKTFVHLSSLKSHKMHHSNNLPFVCDICNKGFPQKGSLKLHKMIHSKEKPFSCTECGKKFNHKCNLDRHTLYHKDEKPFKCEQCGKGFIMNRELQRHLIIHTGEKPFICSICGYQCNRESNLKQHMMKHSDEKPHNCKECGASFKVNWYLKVHMKTHSGCKDYICDVCGKKFLLNSGLRTHMATHLEEKPFACSQCDYKCALQTMLKQHMIKHSGVKPFACSECDYRFFTKQALKTHKRTHSGERPFVCDVCQRDFTTKLAMQTHKYLHTGEKPCKCEVCGKSFRRSHTLKVHMFSHTGEKKFECTQCGYKCATKDKMTIHVKTHSKEKPFECGICGNRYTTRGNLTKHKCVGRNSITHHNNQSQIDNHMNLNASGIPVNSTISSFEVPNTNNLKSGITTISSYINCDGNSKEQVNNTSTTILTHQNKSSHSIISENISNAINDIVNQNTELPSDSRAFQNNLISTNIPDSQPDTISETSLSHLSPLPNTHSLHQTSPPLLFPGSNVGRSAPIQYNSNSSITAAITNSLATQNLPYSSLGAIGNRESNNNSANFHLFTDIV